MEGKKKRKEKLKIDEFGNLDIIFIIFHFPS